MLMNPITQEKQKNEREVWECAVSWSWLLSFIKENETRLKNLSTQDVVNQIVIPATIDNKSRYVDLLPNSCVSLPTYFASHVWNAPFLDLVESLREHIGDNVSEDVFVWLDIFAVNQHRDSGTQASDLKGLNIAVEKSNKTIVCIDTNAKLLTRIWCLFEIWHTFKLNVQRLAVVTRNTDVEQLKNIFITCDVAAAQATVLADRDRILEEIKKSMAFKKMNEDIKNALVDSARFEVQRVVNIYGENSVSIIRTLEKLVKMLSFVGKFDEAKPYAEKSLEICKNAYGLEHSETATSIHNFGTLLDDMAKYAEAKTYYEESLEIRKRVLGSKHSDTATSLHNLGFLSNNMGKYEKAKSYYEESLKIRKELFDPKHPDIATSLHYFAVLLRHMKEYEKAKDYYGQSLAIRKEVFGAEHSSVATSLNNLGALLTDMKDYKEAKFCLEKALEIREKVFGEHSNTASTLNNLGTLFCDMKDYEKAKTYYLKSLAIREKTGSEHAQNATALHNFATLLNNMGEYDEAKTYYQKALAIREKSLPSKHPDTIKTFDALTVLLNKIENN